MSLFIRMAQSRAGAERLLEAQLLPILAQCDYLDTRPEADQSFIGSPNFSTLNTLASCLTLYTSQIRSRYISAFRCAKISPIIHACSASC